MALLSNIRCHTCGEAKQVAHGSGEWPRTCHDCASAALKAKRDAHFAELAKLPIEERLRKVEEWIYDYQPHREIKF